jgi:hypothetical protein
VTYEEEQAANQEVWLCYFGLQGWIWNVVEMEHYCTFLTVCSSIFCVTRKFKRDLVQNGRVEGIGVT